MKKTLLILSYLILSSYLFAQNEIVQIQKCLVCHGKKDFSVMKENGEKKFLYIDQAILDSSIHAKRKCQDCHSDITEITAVGHKKNVQKVSCIRCHYEGNSIGAPQTMMYSQYLNSVHGKATTAGNPKAPKCQDCHGSHLIQKAGTSKSSVYKSNIAKVCGKCHLKSYTDYITSIHGRDLDKGITLDVPSCIDCHGEHSILRPSDSTSSVSKTNLANTCSRCHAAASVMNQFGVQTKQVATYKESFHGIASEFGEKKVANCASCHNNHDIRPSTDPTSTVYPANIPKTCGKCHPDANANYAKGKIHLDSKSSDSGPIYYISAFFKYLTICTLIGLFIHIGLDLSRRSFKRLKNKIKI